MTPICNINLDSTTALSAPRRSGCRFLLVRTCLRVYQPLCSPFFVSGCRFLPVCTCLRVYQPLCSHFFVCASFFVYASTIGSPCYLVFFADPTPASISPASALPRICALSVCGSWVADVRAITRSGSGGTMRGLGLAESSPNDVENQTVHRRCTWTNTDVPRGYIGQKQVRCVFG